MGTATAPPNMARLLDEVFSTLDRDGIVMLPQLMSDKELSEMRTVFGSRLKHLRWSDVDGYERTELYRHMVEDVLTLHQGFVDMALHPLVKQVLNRYLGDHYELCEAKGWKSLATKSDFHGWHGDAWYDQALVTSYIPREVKLAFYLSDVKTGFFQYIKGSHRKQAPRQVDNPEISGAPESQIFEASAKAGTAFLFDTSGIHRQSVPILEDRLACFYNYHDPDVPLQEGDCYRYHPLILNAAFLGDLSKEEARILGFGNKKNYILNSERTPRHPKFQRAMELAFAAELRLDDFSGRVKGKVRMLLGRSKPA